MRQTQDEGQGAVERPQRGGLVEARRDGEEAFRPGLRARNPF